MRPYVVFHFLAQLICPKVGKADGNAADGEGALEKEMGNRDLSKFPTALGYNHLQTNSQNSSCTSVAPLWRGGDPKEIGVTHTS